MKIPLGAWFIRIFKWILIGVYFFVTLVFLMLMVALMYGGIVETAKLFL
jgi:hypothetical protein